MAVYYPVEFDLNEFQLALGPKAAAGFHKRMKDLGFTGVDSKGMMVWTRHDSRICAMLQPDMGLIFLQDFYDHTPGGTVYAILEKMCVNFRGTMLGKYKIPAIGKEWGIRISQGMVIGDPAGTVGQRDTVAQEVQGANGATFPSGSAQLPGGQSGQSQPQAAQAAQQGGTIQSANFGPGQVPGGQPGQSGQNAAVQSAGLTQEKRDKLFAVYVDQQFQQWVTGNPGASQTEQLTERVRLIKEFDAQFPREETEEEKAQKIIAPFIPYLKSKLGNGQTIYVEESDLDDIISDFAADSNGTVNEAELSYVIHNQLMKDAKGDTGNGYEYHIQLDPNTRLVANFEDEIDLSIHQGNPAFAKKVQTTGHQHVMQQAPSNVPAASPNFTAAHAVAYQQVTSVAAGNTPSTPAGWTVPVQDLQAILKDAAYVIGNIFTIVGGFKTGDAMSNIMEHMNDAAMVLQMHKEGRAMDYIWESFWVSFPGGDVKPLVAHYTQMAAKLSSMQPAAVTP